MNPQFFIWYMYNLTTQFDRSRLGIQAKHVWDLMELIEENAFDMYCLLPQPLRKVYHSCMLLTLCFLYTVGFEHNNVPFGDIIYTTAIGHWSSNKGMFWLRMSPKRHISSRGKVITSKASSLLVLTYRTLLVDKLSSPVGQFMHSMVLSTRIVVC